MSAEYRIEFQIQRRLDAEDDFTEIGFGSTGGWGDLDACTHALDSAVSNGEWETEPGHPDPDEVMAEIAEADVTGANDDEWAKVTCPECRAVGQDTVRAIYAKHRGSA